MSVKHAAPVTMGIITAAASITCATFAHYADTWEFVYLIAAGFALISGVAAALIWE